MLTKLVTFGLVLAAGGVVEPAAAANDSSAAGGLSCAGVWQLNEKLTRRARPTVGPIMQFFEPWGKNGWMRMNTGDLREEITPKTNVDPNTDELPEWHFEQFNDKPYQVFGGDPSLAKTRKITDRIFMTTRFILGKESDPSFWVFSKDCKRLTYYYPEGVNRHGIPGQNQYYNDLRVFDMIEPPTGSVATAADVFGGWELDRAASKLTIPPKEAETVIIIPWGKSGWLWNQLSGGVYQAEDLHKGKKRVECGAAVGPAAIPCQGAPVGMMLYWATWDSKTFPTYGTRRVQLQLKRVNDRTFDVTLFKTPQTPARGDKATAVFSQDGRHLTVTTKAGATSGVNHFDDDVRVYNRIDPDKWPTVTP